MDQKYRCEWCGKIETGDLGRLTQCSCGGTMRPGMTEVSNINRNFRCGWCGKIETYNSSHSGRIKQCSCGGTMRPE
jgi:hypothetical protein